MRYIWEMNPLTYEEFLQVRKMAKDTNGVSIEKDTQLFTSFIIKKT